MIQPNPELRSGYKLVAHLPKGQPAKMEVTNTKMIITFEDGRVIEIPLNQEN